MHLWPVRYHSHDANVPCKWNELRPNPTIHFTKSCSNRIVVRSFLIRIPLWLVPYKYQSISEAKGTIIQIHTRKMLLNITYLPSKFPTSQQRLGLLLWGLDQIFWNLDMLSLNTFSTPGRCLFKKINFQHFRSSSWGS